MNNPLEKAGPWKNETLLDRIKSCISMLHVRGFLSDGECRKVVKRVCKWRDKYEKSEREPLPKPQR